MCTGDFPYLESTSLHPNQQEMADWHQRFAEHFELLPHVHFQTFLQTSTSWTRDVTRSLPSNPTPRLLRRCCWTRCFSPSAFTASLSFPRLPGSKSLTASPHTPKCSQVVSPLRVSSSFSRLTADHKVVRRGAPFKGKRCIVIGSRLSASDVCQVLVKDGASEVYMSHRAGVILVRPRPHTPSLPVALFDHSPPL